MRELVRLRRFAHRLGALLVLSLVAVILTSALRSLAVWQTQAV